MSNIIERSLYEYSKIEQNFNELEHVFNQSNKTDISDLKFSKNIEDVGKNASISGGSNIFNLVKENLSCLDVDPENCKGGILEYTSSLNRVKFFIQTANEVRKHLTNFIDKVTSIGI